MKLKKLGYFTLGLIIGAILAVTAVSHADPLINGVNGLRADRGLSVLTENAQLDQAALNKANDMCANNYWSHTTPDGRRFYDFDLSAGYAPAPVFEAGENLAYDFDDEASTVVGWTNSPSHYAAMVGDWQDIGSASIVCPFYQGESNVTISVNEFGGVSRPQPSTPVVAPAPQPVIELTPVPVKTGVAYLQDAGTMFYQGEK